jgi:hypothetical protein
MPLAAHERTHRLDDLYADYYAISESAASLVCQLKTEADAVKRRELTRRFGEHDRQRLKVLEEMERVWVQA